MRKLFAILILLLVFAGHASAQLSKEQKLMESGFSAEQAVLLQESLVLDDSTAASACVGSSTLTAATAVTIETTCIETGDYVLITRTSADADGGGQEYVDNIVDGVSFDVTSITSDTATFSWMIVKGE